MKKIQVDKKVSMVLLTFLGFCCFLITILFVLINSVTNKNNTNAQNSVPEITPQVTQTVNANPEIPNTNLNEIEKLNLKFKNINFNISGRNNDTNSPSYWIATPEIKNVAGLDALYEFFPNDKGDLFYIPAKDTFYSLGPSSNESWTLVDDAYINKNVGTFSKTITEQDMKPTTIKTTCNKGSRKAGDLFFTALECRETYTTKIDGKSQQVMDIYFSKCLYNYNPGKFLMFSQDSASAGSDRDACGILYELGFLNIEIIK
jgi:hypothetical protein